PPAPVASRLAQRYGHPRASQLQAIDLPHPAGHRPGTSGGGEKPQNEVRVLSWTGADPVAGQVRGRAKAVRAGGQARILRSGPVLQSGNRLPQEPLEGPGIRSVPEGPEPEGRTFAYSGRAGEVRSSRRTGPLIPAARPLREPSARQGALSPAPPVRPRPGPASLR